MNPARWRKMTWTLLLFIAVVAVGIAVNSDGMTCGRSEQVGAQEAGCELQLSDQGGAVFCIGLLGFIVLGIGWLMTRPSKPSPRICPSCGLPIKEGRTTCSKCGYAVPAAEADTLDGQGVESASAPR